MPSVAIKSAVIVGARTAPGVRAIADLFTNAGLAVTIVERAEQAAAGIVTAPDGDQPCVAIDVGDDPATAAGRIAALLESVPSAAPIAVALHATADLVLAAWRAGAAELIDPAADGAAGVRAMLDRVTHARRERHTQRRHVASLRTIVEDFFRDLVRTERRSIDLEHRLKQAERPSSPSVTDVPTDLDADREPTVFLVEDDAEIANRLVDELEDAGLVTFAFLNGEDAVRDADKMAAKTQAIDLAIVDLKLPGIDGLETVRRLRAKRPGLAAFLMTGFSDVETATSAADLGVVGFVLKPFDDLPQLIARIKEQAQQAMLRTREHHYLQRIKERHEKVLSRYRKLVAEIES
ncbi:MAG: response regulator [Deltaproteobacteria bacterium]|nr:response regulator [Deltaproteobacteria bacterium]